MGVGRAQVAVWRGAASVWEVRRYWTKREVARLRSLYPCSSNADVARRLGRTASAVQQKAMKLGLRKPDSLKHRYPEGHRPWNAGVKYDAGGRSRKTRFKNGHKPQTWVPVGTERVNRDGILMRKVADTRVRSVDWRPVHVLKWERYRGPVPDGHIVVFKSADKRDFRIRNLECITRADNMRRNTVHRLPKDLARAVQMLGALNRQIHRREADGR